MSNNINKTEMDQLNKVEMIQTSNVPKYWNVKDHEKFNEYVALIEPLREAKNQIRDAENRIAEAQNLLAKAQSDLKEFTDKRDEIIKKRKVLLALSTDAKPQDPIYDERVKALLKEQGLPCNVQHTLLSRINKVSLELIDGRYFVKVEGAYHSGSLVTPGYEYLTFTD